MESSSPTMFVIDDGKAYAMTPIETWLAVQFLLTKLEPIDLDSDDRVCVICQQEFDNSQDVKRSHAPVRTVCGHIFGKACIINWLDPLRFWLSMNTHLDDDMYANSSCPTCRQIFFSTCKLEPVEFLACRLSIWDSAYATAGVARSEKRDAFKETSCGSMWNIVVGSMSMNQPRN